MTSITKGAIKAIKFYKHVVQSVEKFIQKCRPEYKVPGLYVIDSIVRQSRHQFGPDKDVFAPRFAKNVRLTFFHLYRCPEEDKSKVIRVLNLWQKNAVFPSEVIQPLFDLADPNSDVARQTDEMVRSGKAGKPPAAATAAGAAGSGIPSKSSPGSVADQHMNQQLQTILQLLKNHGQPPKDQQPKFKLDFDYSDDEDGGNDHSSSAAEQPSPAMLEALQGILENKMVLNKLKSMGAITDYQIQQLQQLLPAAQQQAPTAALPNPQVNAVLNSVAAGPVGMVAPPQQPSFVDLTQGPPHTGALLGLSSVPWGAPQAQAAVAAMGAPLRFGAPLPQQGGQQPSGGVPDEDIQIVEDRSSSWRGGGRASNRRRSRSRSRSRSRDRKRGRRSRSRSRDRGGRRRRSRSRSRDKRDRMTDEERQHMREREKKGLPPVKKEHLSGERYYYKHYDTGQV